MIAVKYQFEDDCRRRALELIDFTTLVAHVKDSFPFFTEQSFRLTYVDEEESCITVSSQDDLEEAVRVAQNKQKILNFVIRPRTRLEPCPQPTETEVFGALHPNIFCDGCGNHVRGIRYNCTICPDFDLCSSCEARQAQEPINHDQLHPMIRFIKPPSLSMLSSSSFSDNSSETNSSTPLISGPLVRLSPASRLVEPEENQGSNAENCHPSDDISPHIVNDSQLDESRVEDSQLEESTFENLRILKELGFLNETLNKELLRENSNDLNQVIGKLLDP
eukprot:TRINITY_DN1423_c0_g1_i1.p1 TRINITY_DN1423_c0_g1~~TRINITY_DN1423_c0_g1_i1.p1  ORF type:complete len:277 (-),score=34.11 TRINITY_DN1423_c0_g1_i1:112-942(-)